MPARMSVDERVAFRGCLNARDLGGHLTDAGVRIPARRLFRSDCIPVRPGDGGGGLRTVIDLRSTAETRGVGPAGARLHAPLDNPQRGMSAEDWLDPHAVAERYLTVLLDGEESVSEILAVVTDATAYPVAVHCTGGKDRTGIVVALLLTLLGVPDDDIDADYALSGFGAARLLIALRNRVEDPALLDRFAPALLATRPDNVRCFLDRVRTKFGSVEGYVEEIGMTSAIGWFRTVLLG